MSSSVAVSVSDCSAAYNNVTLRFVEYNKYWGSIDFLKLSVVELNKVKSHCSRSLNVMSNKKIKKFFTQFLLWGIICLLFSAFLDVAFSDTKFVKTHKIAEIFLKVFVVSSDSLGAGLIIGYFVDMVKGSEDFLKTTTSNLQEVVISKSFINTLSYEEKTDIIHKCLLGNDSSRELDEYISYKTQQINNLCNGHLRTNIDYISTASKDTSKNRIVLKTEMSYKIYKINGKFQEIKHAFDSSECKILKMEIVADAKNYIYPTNQLKTSQEQINQKETAFINIVKVPSKFLKYNSITLKITVEEYGYDHWAHLIWMSLYPTYNISYKINCLDNLIIKHYHIFDKQDGLYRVDKTINQQGNTTSCFISCEQWTDPYTGFALVISEP